jgi:hypothetical protein
MLDTECWILNIGCSLLVAGCWLLVADRSVAEIPQHAGLRVTAGVVFCLKKQENS